MSPYHLKTTIGALKICLFLSIFIMFFHYPILILILSSFWLILHYTINPWISRQNINRMPVALYTTLLALSAYTVTTTGYPIYGFIFAAIIHSTVVDMLLISYIKKIPQSFSHLITSMFMTVLMLSTFVMLILIMHHCREDETIMRIYSFCTTVLSGVMLAYELKCSNLGYTCK